MLQDDKCGIGYGLMGLLQDPTIVIFNYKLRKWTFNKDLLAKHLKAIADAGADFIRFLLWGVWAAHKYGKLSQFQPFLFDEKEDAWNLDSYNDYYFPILTQAVQLINDLNMTADLPWHDNCQLHAKYRRWSPWANNVQGIQSFYEPKADKYTNKLQFTLYNRYWKKYDVRFPFGNEDENKDFPAMAERVILPFVKKYNLDFSRLTYGATVKPPIKDSVQYKVRLAVREMFGRAAERKIIMEDHGYPFISSSPDWEEGPIRCSDDGFYGGKSLCDKNERGSRPSAAEWKARAAYILKKYPTRLISFEHLTAVYPPCTPENTACQAATISAISASYRARFGT
jgi:hypothetical protein